MGKTAGPHLPDYFPSAAKTGKCGTEVGGWCRGAVQVRLIMGGVLLAQGSPCCMSGRVTSQQGMLCLQGL